MRQQAPPPADRRPDYPPGLRCRVRGRLTLAGATLVLVAASAIVPATAIRSTDHRYAPDRVLVGYHRGTPPSAMERIERSAGATFARDIGAGARLLRVETGEVGATIDTLRTHQQVRYAEPDFFVSFQSVPDDQHFGRQWHLRNTGQVVDGSTGTPGADVDAVRAWGVTTGSRDIVVGVIDSGIEDDHPDLRDNMWANPGGVNGCPAGTHGYDTFNLTCNPRAGSHGTGVAGVVGAVGGNGIGVSGVAQRVRLMDLKWSISAAGTVSVGTGTFSHMAAAVDWAIRARRAGVNVRVLNVSAGGGEHSTAMRDAIQTAGEEGMLLVAGAGNGGTDNDQQPVYPCSYDLDNVICVASTDNRDKLRSTSNWGAESVDLSAPGVDVYTTTGGEGYTIASGTSFAAPHVAGAAALLFANGETSVATVKAKILHNVDKLDSLSGKVATGGRLNVYKALTGPVPPSPTPTPPAATDPPSTPSPSQQPTASPGGSTSSPVPEQDPGSGKDGGGGSSHRGGGTSGDSDDAGAASQERDAEDDGGGVLSSVARPLGAAAKAVTALPGAAVRAVTRLPGATLRAVTNLPGAAVDLFTNPTKALGWPWGRIAFYGLGTGLAAFGGYAGHRRGLFASVWSRLPGWRRGLLLWRRAS